MNFRVRVASAEDVAAVVALERGVEMAPHWEEGVYAAMLRMETGAALQRRLVVAEDADGRMIGFAVGRVLLAGDAVEAELESVAVRETARRCGVGRALCAVVMAWARGLGAEEMELEVRASSAGALALYAGLGFAEKGRRREYYQQPVEDAVQMVLRWR